MYWLLILLFGFVAIFWLTYGLRVVLTTLRLPRLRHAEPVMDTECPAISILFAARDEEEKLPDALRTLLSLDYANYEIVAVDDRSTDSTSEILRRHSAQDARLKVLRIDELPAGWLGKPHALQRAYGTS